ncbi:hypothetical protein [Priestia megaterium]|uniref:hypothetical protein n=1 Tax=Priestia megaterium TaxID=1404 RepID=UPI00203D551A|nr:hypothetical protein [Priestia megaterium]MCM3099914.1 hypothetical protein [Priestia megaterium]
MKNKQITERYHLYKGKTMNELMEERQLKFKKRQERLREKWLPERLNPLKNRENSQK